MLPVMTRTRRMPSEPLSWFDRDFDRLLGRWWNEPELLGRTYPVDIHEDDDNVYVEAELPGFTRDQISISVEDGVLHITAERGGEQQPEGDEGYHLRERRYRRFERAFSLPTSVDDAKAEAKLSDGVLHLTLPKTAEVKPRRIAIK